MHAFIIGYDICEEKRLTKVHNEMVKMACPIEYSIFLFKGSMAHLSALMDEILPILNLKMDDVRCYELPNRGQEERLGKPVLPEGIIWTGLPVQWN